MDAGLVEMLGDITQEEQVILGDRKLDMHIYTDGEGQTIEGGKLVGPGEFIALRPHTRFIGFPRHSHDYVEIVYMCTGSTTHIINDRQTVRLERGELLFLNCHAKHEIMRAEYDDIGVNFIVLPGFLSAVNEMIAEDNIISRFFADNLSSAGGSLNYLHYKVADVLPVQNLVENLVWNLVRKPPGHNSLNQVTMGLLFLQLLSHPVEADTRSADSYSGKLMVAVFREIEKNYRTASLNSLAISFDKSPSQTSKLIKQATGKTFKRLLQEKRFSKAVQMLDSGKTPVADIAAEVGYENTSYFHRRFLELYGVSPAKYRQQKTGK